MRDRQADRAADHRDTECGREREIDHTDTVRDLGFKQGLCKSMLKTHDWSIKLNTTDDEIALKNFKKSH